MEDAHVRIKLAAYSLLEEKFSLADEEDADGEKISVCIPGNQCPNWFSYCSTQPLFTIELPSPSNILGFAFCVILAASDNKYNVGCECSFEADDGETINLESWFLNYGLISVGESQLFSDHIYLWYDARGSALMHKIMHNRVNIKKFTFRFFTTPLFIKGMEMSLCEVSNKGMVDPTEVMKRSYGVQPIYWPVDPIEFLDLQPLPKITSYLNLPGPFSSRSWKQNENPRKHRDQYPLKSSPLLLCAEKLVAKPWDKVQTLKSLRSNAPSESLEYFSRISWSSFQEFSLTSKEERHSHFWSMEEDELVPLIFHLQGFDCFTLPLTANICDLYHIGNLQEIDLTECKCDSFEVPNSINWMSYFKFDGSQLVVMPGGLLVVMTEINKHLPWLVHFSVCLYGELSLLFQLDARKRQRLHYVSCSESEDHIKSAVSYLLENCIGSGQHAVDTVMADANVRIIQAADNILKEDNSDDDDDTLDDKEKDLDDEADLDNGKISFCFPGNRIPVWFHNWSTKATLTIDLHSPSKLLGFAFCVVLAANSNAVAHINDLGCECSLEADSGETANIESWFIDKRMYHVLKYKHISDHVYLGYDAGCSALIRDRIELGGENYSLKFSFTFFTKSQYDKIKVMLTCEVEENDIKEQLMIGLCDVLPIYASEDPIIRDEGRIESSSSMETHELEPLPKITRQVIPPPLSSHSWKQTERSGLKEILFWDC